MSALPKYGIAAIYTVQIQTEVLHVVVVKDSKPLTIVVLTLTNAKETAFVQEVLFAKTA